MFLYHKMIFHSDNTPKLFYHSGTLQDQVNSLLEKIICLSSTLNIIRMYNFA